MSRFAIQRHYKSMMPLVQLGKPGSLPLGFIEFGHTAQQLSRYA